MAVAYDAVSPDSASAAGVTTLTSGSWTVGAGSNRVAIGFMATSDVTGATHTGMKLGGSGGTALTQIGSTLAPDAHSSLSAWRLIAPASGSTTSYGNWGSSQGETCIAMLSYTGADQTTPVGTAVTATGTSDIIGAGTATVNVTTVVGDLVVACAFVHNTNASTNPLFTPAGGSTGRYDVENAQIGGYAAVQVMELVASGTTTTMSATFTNADNNSLAGWGIIAFVVNPGSSNVTLAASGSAVTSGVGTSPPALAVRI